VRLAANPAIAAIQAGLARLITMPELELHVRLAIIVQEQRALPRKQGMSALPAPLSAAIATLQHPLGLER